MIKVSYYKNIYDVEGVEVDLNNILRAIRQGKFSSIVNKHREGKIDGKKKVPYFTVGGVFSTRANSNCIKPSGLISIDLDYIENIDELVNIIKNSDLIDYVYAMFTSLGGKGLCVLVRTPPTTDPEEFKGRYRAIYEEFESEVGHLCKVDDLSDLARPRFISYDPNLYANHLPESFNAIRKVESFQNVNHEPMPSMNGYLSEEEEFQEVINRYTEAVGEFGSKGTRHDWILGIGRWMCRGGVGEGYAISRLIDIYNNTDRATDVWQKEVARCIRSSYRTYSAEQGTYRTPKKYNLDEIQRANNIEDAKYNLLMFIEEKKKLANYLVDNKKNSKFVEEEIKFLTKLYKLI